MAEEQQAPSDETAGSEPSGTSASAPPQEPRPGKRRARPKQPPLTEGQIDSPDRLTLALLAVVFGVTALSWGAARFACNLQAPESRAPTALPTTMLADTPKDAAIELQQRWRTQDYAGALELAKGPIVPILESERRACESRKDECERKRNALQREVITTAVVLSQNDKAAEARVTSYIGKTRETYRIQLEQEGPVWKGISRVRE